MAIPLLLVLCACGGDGDGSIQVSYNPAALVASYRQGEITPTLPVSATLSETPAGPVYVALVQDKAVLQDTQLSVSSSPDGKTFFTTLQPSCMLAPGVHSGALTLLMCSDSACLHPIPLRGAVLPYQFSVSSGTLITGAIDGVTQPTTGARCTWLILRTRVGQRVDLISNVPVTWSCSINTTFGIPSITGLAITETTWSGVMAADKSYLPGTRVGGFSCSIKSADMISTWIHVDISVDG
jgi:hypothetical protein